MNSVRSAPASSVISQAIALKLECVHRKSSPTVRGRGESDGAQSRTKVNFDRTMMQALEWLQ